MNRRLALYDFKCQRQAARNRKIEWLFEFEEWLAWWAAQLGPDWQDKRGKKRGHFVMARKKDKGPYASWNVECKLATQNSSEANRGEKCAKSCVADVVALKIFKAKGTNRSVAIQFGVSTGVVSAIKRKVHYRHVTSGLTHPQRQRGPLPGDLNTCTKIPDADISKIRSSAESVKSLAERYGVSKGHIYDIKNGLKRRGSHKAPPPQSSQAK